MLGAQDWTDLDEGWMFGQWESGPWLGYHSKKNTFGSYGWVITEKIMMLLLEKTSRQNHLKLKKAPYPIKIFSGEFGKGDQPWFFLLASHLHLCPLLGRHR